MRRVALRLCRATRGRSVKRPTADLVAREVIAEGGSFTFHGLRKNACCYLLELGLNDSDVGSVLGMSPDIMRHYGERARAFTMPAAPPTA